MQFLSVFAGLHQRNLKIIQHFVDFVLLFDNFLQDSVIVWGLMPKRLDTDPMIVFHHPLSFKFF